MMSNVIVTKAAIANLSIIEERCEISPAHIGPYTSISNDATIRNCEIENSIVMDGVYADCRKRILDSMSCTRYRIVGLEYGIERGMKLVLGDSTYVGV
jgi:NDP-sugar pyrophosphorylase family protein